jgi:hypothetical protein
VIQSHFSLTPHWFFGLVKNLYLWWNRVRAMVIGGLDNSKKWIALLFHDLISFKEEVLIAYTPHI